MKHTEEYLQAKWVTENPKGYDERDVVRANSYCKAYLDGYNQALSIAVEEQSEQLKAFTNHLLKSGEMGDLDISDVDDFLKANNCG